MEDIKNRSLNPIEFKRLRQALESQGLNLSAEQEPGDMGAPLHLNPANMSFDAIEAARNNLNQQDATGNLLGSLRQDAGQDPVLAASTMVPPQQTNILNSLRQTAGQDPLIANKDASMYKGGLINKFQLPTKQDKKVEKEVIKKKAEKKIAEEENAMNRGLSPVQTAPEQNTQDELKALQGTANENLLIANILKATNRINEGGNLTKVDDSLANDLQKQSQLPVEQLGQRQEQKTKDLQLNKLASEYTNEKSLNDPNSNISKLARDTMQKLGYSIPEGVSAGVLKQSGVNVGTLLGIKENAEARKETAKMYLEGKREIATQAAQEKAKKESTISDKQVDAVTTLDDAISAIDGIIKEKPKYQTGRADAVGNTIGQFINTDDPKYSAFRSRVGEQLAQYIKSISGAAVSAYERQALLENMPNINDSNETFMEKSKSVLNKLREHKYNYLSNLAKKGKDVKEYMPENEKSDGDGSKRIKDPNTGLVHLIPKDQVKNALAAGGVAVE